LSINNGNPESGDVVDFANYDVESGSPNQDIEIDNTPRVEVEVEKPTRVGYVDCGSEGEPLGVMVFVTADELRSLGIDPTASTEVEITVTDSGVSLSSR
jgi:hypothetical protein